jgi:hypothetical protein
MLAENNVKIQRASTEADEKIMTNNKLRQDTLSMITIDVTTNEESYKLINFNKTIFKNIDFANMKEKYDLFKFKIDGTFLSNHIAQNTDIGIALKHIFIQLGYSAIDKENPFATSDITKPTPQPYKAITNLVDKKFDLIKAKAIKLKDELYKTEEDAYKKKEEELNTEKQEVNTAVDLENAKILAHKNETIEQIKKDTSKLYCQYIRMKKIYYHCKLRITEGKMINKELQDLLGDIKGVLKSSLSSGGGLLPIVYDNIIFPYCRNLDILSNEPYDQFYLKSNNKPIGNIIKIFNESVDKGGYGIDLNKLNFAILTVINNTDTVNNPPNPPYININNLLTSLSSTEQKDKKLNKIKSEIILLQNKLKEYKFYETLTTGNARNSTLFNITNINSLGDESIIPIANYVGVVIGNNNASTLIGTLITSDALQNLTCDQYPCIVDSKLENETINSFIDTVPINKENLKFKTKYLKYKSKYLELKRK